MTEKFTTARIGHKHGESNKSQETAFLDKLIKATRYTLGKKSVNGFKQRKNLNRFAFKIQFVCVALLSL